MPQNVWAPLKEDSSDHVEVIIWIKRARHVMYVGHLKCQGYCRITCPQKTSTHKHVLPKIVYYTIGKLFNYVNDCVGVDMYLCPQQNFVIIGKIVSVISQAIL